MSEINILHLSDIHFRKKKGEDNSTFRRVVQRKTVSKIEEHLKKHEPPDFVVVTGDIAFSGKELEFEEAEEFFEKLKGKLPEKTVFLMVPGNHDVDRDRVSNFLSMHRLVKEGKADAFLDSKEDSLNFINVKFDTFKSFLRKLNPLLLKKTNDYFWVQDFPEMGVSFLGLNSCWACESDDDRFNIALGYPQVIEALERSEGANRILLTHHPPFNWLKDLEYGKCRVELFNNCRLWLHGHTHSDNAMVIKDPTGSCLCLGANASYTDDKEGFIGFQFLHIDWGNNRVNVRVWPYIFDERRHDFVPDRERWPKQGKEYFDIDAARPSVEKSKKALRRLQIPEKYRDWLKEFHSTIAVEKLDPHARAINIPLPQVYIRLEAVNPFYKPQDDEDRDEKRRKGGGEKIPGIKKGKEGKEPEYIDIEALLGRVNCVLLRGTAGMGKTTLVKHLAYTISDGSGHPSLNGYLPVLVLLKDLWPLFKREIGLTFESLLETYCKDRLPGLPMEIIKDYLDQDRALFLLDGLDEVPEHLRAPLMDTIATFRFENKDNRFLLTGRPHGIAGRATEVLGSYIHDIEPLDREKANRFISDWFRAVSARATGLADMTADDMISEIALHEHVSIFTQNPLLLTAVCILYQDNKRIPDQRAELYRRIVDNLLHRRFTDPLDPGKVGKIGEYLMILAYHLQEQNLKKIEQCEAKDLLRRVFSKEQGETEVQYNTRMDHLFEQVEPHCGLLKRLDCGEVEFFHLSFQEFLSARYMINCGIDIRGFLDKGWWEETILLHIGFTGIDRKQQSNELVKEILDSDPGDEKERQRLWLLGSKALRDIQSFKRDKSVVDLAAGKLELLLTSNADLNIRFEAGEILGVLGDRRINAFSPEMVRVEAEEFIRGSGEGLDREKPERHIYLDAYMIGKYPVTNQEFKEFVNDGGYKEKEFWTSEGWKWRKEENISEPLYWHDRKWNGPNFPVVGISWFEADAFCKWLSHKTGKQYRLPTEAEWEKAARGTEGREYPWGNEFDEKKCNSWEGKLRRTSPVGIFQEDRGPCGCFDMAGNVVEWCLDWFDEKYYKKSPDKNPKGPSEGALRVLRGGSWGLHPVRCRSAFRRYSPPASRYRLFGLRLFRSL
jgi:formylglycine-generating enzyme required for sulfatase activity/predicted MPP superfamily phosphohydrolase/energy-coupling factor transporter ATP-binding protein EcfA2